MKAYTILSFLSLGTLLITSCKGDDPKPENPEELITTLIMELEPHGGGPVTTFQFQDIDGDGGIPPVITADTLVQNTLYHATLMLLNEASTPVIDITPEILDEAEEHQFFFEVVSTVVFPGVQMTHAYDDVDMDGLPIGLMNTMMTFGFSEGPLRIILRHNPDKSATGPDHRDITNAGGETDIEVSFPVVIR